MLHKPYSSSKQLVVATTLALGTSGIALADDSSMNPFIGDSYKYFTGGHNAGDPGQFNPPGFGNTPADPSWRQNHPAGLTERDLQALSSSGLSAFASQRNPQVAASALADPLWRQRQLNGLTEALSTSTLSRWQLASGSENTATASIDQANVAQKPSKETFSVRLARLLHPDSGTQAGTSR
jgi:hypothetical protein